MSPRSTTTLFLVLVVLGSLAVAPLHAQLENTVDLVYKDSNGTQETSAMAVSTVVVEADLGLSLSSSPGAIFGDTEITLVLVIENFGPSNSTGGSVQASIPVGTTFDSSPDGCFENGGFVECPFGALDALSSTELNAVLTLPIGSMDSLTSDGTVTGFETDPTAANDSNSTIIEYALFADGFEGGGIDAWTSSTP